MYSILNNVKQNVFFHESYDQETHHTMVGMLKGFNDSEITQGSRTQEFWIDFKFYIFFYPTDSIYRRENVPNAPEHVHLYGKYIAVCSYLPALGRPESL